MVKILSASPDTLLPLSGNVETFRIGGCAVGDLIRSRFPRNCRNEISVRGNFIPSKKITDFLAGEKPVRVLSPEDGSVLADNGGSGPEEMFPDAESMLIRFPWDLLRLNELVLADIVQDVRGEIRERVTIDGIIQLGEESVILPGVFIEGNVTIGRNCKIGPNCYIRGNTTIGDHCHIGQAVEIKNSILRDHVSIGHLSYAGDSIIDSNVNFGAGTIISNRRHDGKQHLCMNNGTLVPTGRRKFGAIIGAGVHTGIHTAIYPGRTLSKGSSTRPGEIVMRAR